MRWGALFAVGLLVLSSCTLAEEGYDQWKTPENRAASLKNVIDPGSLVNPNTGELSVTYPFPPYNGRGFSFTPTLTYSGSYTTSNDQVTRKYPGENPQPFSYATTPPHSEWGYGWSMSPFGFISSERKKESGSPAYYEYRMALPGSGSEKLVAYGAEVPAEGDLSVPGWNSGALIQVFHIETNPYFVIKRYRTYKGQLHYGVAIPTTDIYDGYRWYVQSPSNDKYYFDKAVYSRVPITIAGASTAFDVPKSMSVYFKEYSRWDLTKMIPHGIAANEVDFAYESDSVSYVHKVREQYEQLLNSCRAQDSDCGAGLNWFWFFENNQIPWDSLGHTDYVSNSYPTRIYQPFVGTGSPALTFFDYSRSTPVLETNFATVGGSGPFQIYCKDPSEPYCSKSSPGAYGTDPDGTPYMTLWGKPSNPWGAYVNLTGLLPHTTYVIKGKYSVTPQGGAPVISDCTEPDLELTQWNNVDATPTKGYYALVKVGSVAVKSGSAYRFNPDTLFSKSSSLSSGADAAWFGADDWQGGGYNCWPHSGSCFGGKAGIISNFDAYLVNCYSIASNPGYQYFEETFTTADESARVVYVAAYNPKLTETQPILIKMRDLSVEMKPEVRLVTGVDYDGKSGNVKLKQSFNLFYDSDSYPDGKPKPNLKKIQQVGFLTGLNAQDSMPATEFSYETSGANAGKVLTRITLPTGGYISLGSYQFKDKTWTEQNPWNGYYILPFYDIPPTNPDLTKRQLVVQSVSVNDGTNTRTTSYDYMDVVPGTDWVWSDLRKAYFKEDFTVTDPAGFTTRTYFYVGDSYPDSAGPLFGKTNWQVTSGTFPNGAWGYMASSSSEYGVYSLQASPSPLIFHVRQTKAESTVWNTVVSALPNSRTTKTTYDSFDTTRCDAPTATTNHGFTDVTADEVSTNSTYIETGDYRCLLNSSEQTVGGVAKTRSENEYYGSGAKQGLLKKVTAKVLGRPAEDTFTSLDYDVYGNVKTITDALGAVTTMDYDTAYNLYSVKHTAPLSLVEEMFYDEFSRPNRVKGVNNEESFVQYDDLNRICKYQMPGGSTPELVGSETVSSICNAQPVVTPVPREGVPVTLPPNPPVVCGGTSCSTSEWCCNVPSGSNTCIPLTQGCPSNVHCSPACNSGYGCCDNNNGQGPQCRRVSFKCSEA